MSILPEPVSFLKELAAIPLTTSLSATTSGTDELKVLLEVFHHALYVRAGGSGGLLQILERNVAVVAVILIGLLASTRHTHWDTPSTTQRVNVIVWAVEDT
jgi:hypothetical protein